MQNGHITEEIQLCIVNLYYIYLCLILFISRVGSDYLCLNF